MTSRYFVPVPRFTQLLLFAAALAIAGCHSSTPSSDSSLLRMATKADLDFTIRDITPSPSKFPSVVTDLRSKIDDDVIVTYAAGSVTIHCGPYIQTGPAGTFGRRREILDAHGFIDFLPKTGGWANAPNNAADLMLPTELPPGTYDVWATFVVVGDLPTTVQTLHESYTVK
jgi:hypothetical protein